MLDLNIFKTKNEILQKEYINNIYKELVKSNKLTNEIFLQLKILSDYYYKDMLLNGCSFKEIFEAGFIFDNCDFISKERFDENYLQTPYNKIDKNKLKKEKPVILLTTGSFSPIHIGHINMMNEAKDILEKNGYNIIGGYFSLSHDKYVNKKYEGSAASNIFERIRLSEISLLNTDYMVDKWEALSNNEPINFTDVIIYLKKYFLYHFYKEIEVAYVFGEDNFNFIKPFENKGIAVCVERNKKEKSKEYNKTKELFNLKDNRLFFIESNCSNNISSSKIRKGNIEFLKEEARELYGNEYYQEGLYLLRNDLKELEIEEKYINQLIDIFNKYFIEVKVIDIKKQNEEAKKYISKVYKTLSLDVYVKGDYNLEISRLFEIAGGQYKPECLTERPDQEPIMKQINKIPKGDYQLIEDDIASGNTIRYLKELLSKENIFIKEEIILAEFQNCVPELKNNTVFDIVDLRDFLFGKKESGLLIKLPNEKKIKVPYIYPYVNLISRTKLNPKEVLKFSLDICYFNLNYYLENIQEKEKINNCLKELMFYCGFKNDIIGFIQWNIKKMENYFK